MESTPALERDVCVCVKSSLVLFRSYQSPLASFCCLIYIYSRKDAVCAFSLKRRAIVQRIRLSFSSHGGDSESVDLCDRCVCSLLLLHGVAEC